jgi:hypothetical protein
MVLYKRKRLADIGFGVQTYNPSVLRKRKPRPRTLNQLRIERDWSRELEHNPRQIFYNLRPSTHGGDFTNYPIRHMNVFNAAVLGDVNRGHVEWNLDLQHERNKKQAFERAMLAGTKGLAPDMVKYYSDQYFGAINN